MNNLRSEYDQNGYVIARKAIDAGLAEETVQHVHWLIERNPGVRPERLHHHLLARDPFMHRLVGDARLVDIAEQFLGPECRDVCRTLYRQTPGRWSGCAVASRRVLLAPRADGGDDFVGCGDAFDG